MARLKKVDCSGPGIRRRRRGKGFEYLDDDGKRVTEPSLLERIRQDRYERVSLNVDESNVLAASLYVTLGFRDVPRPADELESAGTRYMERAL